MLATTFFVGLLVLSQQVEAHLDPVKHHAGTFADPPSDERTRFRYWLPDGGVDPSVVKADVRSVGSVGGGGLEFLGFFEYGGHVGSMPLGANWVTGNFGTPSFQRVFKAALEAHADNGLFMDFPIGPNQGQGVPADTDDEGLQWDLVPYTAAVPNNGVFDSAVPGWGSGELVAFTSALIMAEDSQSYEERDGFNIVNVTYDQYWMQHDSLTDHTHQVSLTDGKARLTFPLPANGSHYRVFSFFQKKTLNKNLEFHLNKEMAADTSIFRNGSYAVDHFSARGAESVIAFWEKNLLTNGVKDLLIRAGNYAWEDSVEVVSNISWSRAMPERFAKEFGYSINAYLPLFSFKHNNLVLQPAAPGKFECFLDDESKKQQHQNNFHRVLAQGYAEYLERLTSWAKSLGKDLSTQPAYNLPIDMMGPISKVGAPECESFGFQDNMELYRRFVGPAHLAGRRVVSNELGAIPSSAYQYTIPRMLFSMNRGFATGVNQYVLHGGQYTGNYYQTTWPGHVGFAYLFSEPFSEKQPAWNHGFQEALDYAARVSHVMRSAVPKVDLVKYLKESITKIDPSDDDLQLLNKGWSYTYLSADNLDHEEAHAVRGILAPKGPAWKAMIVESDQNLTIASVKKLRDHAASGFPIILSGGDPGYFPLFNDTHEEFQQELSKLHGSKHVSLANAESVADQLSSIGLAPRVAARANGTFYTTWYESGDISYALIYSDLVRSSGEVVVASNRTPYIFDPWTGDRSPLLFYKKVDGKTVIPLDLAGNQTMILAFSDKLAGEVPTPRRHVVSSAPSVLGARVAQGAGLKLFVGHSKTKDTVKISDGKKVTVDGASVPPPFQLSNWTLVAERWEAPSNMSDASIVAEKRNTTHELSELLPWNKITDLAGAAGVGYYHSTFQWHPRSGCSAARGAFLHLGRITHGVRVLVNGQKVPSLDIFKSEVNIASYLRPGENEVVIITPTTMWNYLRNMLDKLKTAGSSPFTGPGAPMEVGLIGPVVVTPFKEIRV